MIIETVRPRGRSILYRAERSGQGKKFFACERRAVTAAAWLEILRRLVNRC